jgi:hypothetical protein
MVGCKKGIDSREGRKSKALNDIGDSSMVVMFTIQTMACD